jgi:ABC-type sugar transport system permease subunit
MPSRWERWSMAAFPYLLVIPPLILVMAIFLYPSAQAFINSFQKWKAFKDPSFVGLENYRRMIDDEVFWNALKNSAIIALAIPLWIVADLAIAMLVFQRVRGWRFFRTVFFIPVILSPVVIGIVFNYLFNIEGPINALLRAAGRESWTRSWLGDPGTALIIIIIVMWWSFFGEGVVIFLAGLATVSEDLIDAAKVDGASWFQVLRHVIMPQLLPIIEFYAIRLMILVFKATFPFVYVMTGGGPGFKTTGIDYMIYMQAFTFDRKGYATAIGMVLFVLLLLLALIQIRVLRREDQ